MEGGGEERKSTIHRPFQDKDGSKMLGSGKLEELENPEAGNGETGMDFLTACNEYLDFSKLKFSSTTYGEKKKLCADSLEKMG